MPRGTYRITLEGTTWRLAGPDLDEQFGTRDEALEAGRVWAQSNKPSHLVICSATGRIETQYAFGQDLVRSTS
jgi:hypothetical protein